MFSLWPVVAAMLGFVGWTPDAAAAPIVDPAAKLTRVKIDGQEMLEVSFEWLAGFSYEVVDAASGASAEEIAAARQRNQIPDWIRACQNQRVALTGYILPLEMNDGLATKLIMMRSTMTCCYGAVPNMNDYVMVTMTTRGVKVVQDVPVVLTGIFKVNEVFEDGYLTSIFQMDGEKIVEL